MPRFKVKYGNGQSVVIDANDIESAREKARSHARQYHVGGVGTVAAVKPGMYGGGYRVPDKSKECYAIRGNARCTRGADHSGEHSY